MSSMYAAGFGPDFDPLSHKVNVGNPVSEIQSVALRTCMWLDRHVSHFRSWTSKGETLATIPSRMTRTAALSSKLLATSETGSQKHLQLRRPSVDLWAGVVGLEVAAGVTKPGNLAARQKWNLQGLPPQCLTFHITPSHQSPQCPPVPKTISTEYLPAMFLQIRFNMLWFTLAVGQDQTGHTLPPKWLLNLI